MSEEILSWSLTEVKGLKLSIQSCKLHVCLILNIAFCLESVSCCKIEVKSMRFSGNVQSRRYSQ